MTGNEEESETVVELRQVKLSRPQFELGPLNLKIPKGYITAIVGPNGSGKSSLFRLLLDEPSSGLAPIAWKRLIEVLHRYMKQGQRTLLIATHIIEEVRRLADYIVFMVNGSVIGRYEKDELLGSWHAYFVNKAETLADIEQMPGRQEISDAGAGML